MILVKEQDETKSGIVVIHLTLRQWLLSPSFLDGISGKRIAKFSAYRLVNPLGLQQVPIRCGQGPAGQKNYEINRTAA